MYSNLNTSEPHHCLWDYRHQNVCCSMKSRFHAFQRVLHSSLTTSGDVIARFKSSANKVEMNESYLAAEKRKPCAKYRKKQTNMRKIKQCYSANPLQNNKTLNSTKNGRNSRVLELLEVHQFVVCGCQASMQLGLLVKE